MLLVRLRIYWPENYYCLTWETKAIIYCFFFGPLFIMDWALCLRPWKHLPELCVGLDSNTRRIKPKQSSLNLCLGDCPQHRGFTGSWKATALHNLRTHRNPDCSVGSRPQDAMAFLIFLRGPIAVWWGFLYNSMCLCSWMDWLDSRGLQFLGAFYAEEQALEGLIT